MGCHSAWPHRAPLFQRPTSIGRLPTVSASEASSLWAWLSPPVAVGSGDCSLNTACKSLRKVLYLMTCRHRAGSESQWGGGGVAAAFCPSEGVMLLVKPPLPTPSQCFTTTLNPTPKQSHSTACSSMSAFSPGQREGALGLPPTEVASAGGALNHWGRPVINSNSGYYCSCWKTLLKYPPTRRHIYI